jgi:uncharacterized protein (UPF0332 family)
MTLPDELRMMLEKTRRYIKSAALLQLEGDHDSAVSRLYYAMFYCAEALLLARGHSFSSHRAVISAFAQHYVKSGILPQELHQWLRTAFAKRQISDYEFITAIDAADVMSIQTQSEQFLAQTEAFLQREGHLGRGPEQRQE